MLELYMKLATELCGSANVEFVEEFKKDTLLKG